MSLRKRSQAKMNQQNTKQQRQHFLCAEKLENRLLCILMLLLCSKPFRKKNKQA